MPYIEITNNSIIVHGAVECATLSKIIAEVEIKLNVKKTHVRGMDDLLTYYFIPTLHEDKSDEIMDLERSLCTKFNLA